MKAGKKAAIITGATYAIGYLAIAYVLNDHRPACWPEEARFFHVFLSIVSGGFYLLDRKINEQ